MSTLTHTVDTRFELTEEGLFVCDDKRGSRQQFARYLDLTQVYRDIDTGKLALSIVFDALGQRDERIISRALLTRTGLLTLKEFGADIREDNVMLVLAFLHQRERQVTVSNVFQGIGWGEYDGQRIFRLATAIGTNARYAGDLDLGPRGSPEAMRQLINNVVVGTPPLELMLVIGCAAAVLGIVGRRHRLETLLIHLTGESTTGKTTAEILTLACAGYPGGRHYVGDATDRLDRRPMQDGLMLTLNSTGNAILNGLGGNYGVPRGIDELAMYEGDDLDKLVYKIANGEDKRRLNRDSERKEINAWQTIVITTGEYSWAASCTHGNTGIAMRLFELDLPAWTRDATQADTLKAGLQENYGWLLPDFVAHLMHIGDDAVLACWERWRSECLTRLHQCGLSDRYAMRIAAKLALIMATAELVTEGLGFALNVDGIWDLLATMEQKSVATRDIGDTAYAYLIEYATRHPGQFPAENGYGVGDRKGWVTPDHWVVFFKSAFAELLADQHFNNVKLVETRLTEKGYLDRDQDRPTRKLRIPWTGQPTRVYVLKQASASGGGEQDGVVPAPPRAP